MTLRQDVRGAVSVDEVPEDARERSVPEADKAPNSSVVAQLDVTRHVRGGQSGSRDPLAAEGIVILGGAYDWQRTAVRQLGLPVPAKDRIRGRLRGTCNAGLRWTGCTGAVRAGAESRDRW